VPSPRPLATNSLFTLQFLFSLLLFLHPLRPQISLFAVPQLPPPPRSPHPHPNPPHPRPLNPKSKLHNLPLLLPLPGRPPHRNSNGHLHRRPTNRHRLRRRLLKVFLPARRPRKQHLLFPLHPRHLILIPNKPYRPTLHYPLQTHCINPPSFHCRNPRPRRKRGKGPVSGQAACIIAFAFTYPLTINPASLTLFAEIPSSLLRSRKVGLGIGVLLNITILAMINP
jgi:hypothetical protein